MTSIASQPDWHVGSNGVSYPPEPWRLDGQFIVSTFLVPRRRLGASLLAMLPSGLRPLTIAGRTVIGVAFVRYGLGSVLSYQELLVALPSFSHRGLQYTIPRIWVDSPQSRIGGRELWGIPKDLATFTWDVNEDRVTASMALMPTEAASVSARVIASVPGKWNVPLPTVQLLGGRTIRSINRVRARVKFVRALWSFAAHGPLDFLTGTEPVVSVNLADADVRFGIRVERSAP